MALTEVELAALTSKVAARITGTILGREASSTSSTETEIAGAAVLFCNQVAPNAPEALLREASIRLAGWLYGNRPHVSEHEHTDPSGTTIKLRFNNAAATANGYRASGASHLLARYVERRGGVIDGSSERVTREPAKPVDVGTTIMRCGFTDTLPFADNFFRWFGTANGVELGHVMDATGGVRILVAGRYHVASCRGRSTPFHSRLHAIPGRREYRRFRGTRCPTGSGKPWGCLGIPL